MSNAIRGFLLCAMLALLMVPAAPAHAQDNDVDISYFYDELEQYGRWIDHPQLGRRVEPRRRSATGAPTRWATGATRRTTAGTGCRTSRSAGRSSTTAAGCSIRDDGWLWIPGTEWAPAWVAWRSDDGDDGYVGWAPLPPESSWGPDGDLLYDEYYYDGPQYALGLGVRPPALSDHARHVPLRGAAAAELHHPAPHASTCAPIRRFDRRVFNAGLDVRRFERLVGRPVPRMRLRSISNPREQNFRQGGPDIPVFRPNIIERRDGDNRRPNFRDRPPGDPGSFVRRPPDGRATPTVRPWQARITADGTAATVIREAQRPWPGDRGKGPDFKDSNRGPDGRPDVRDGQRSPTAPAIVARDRQGDGPEGRQQGAARHQGRPAPYKGPAVNEPPKQPPSRTRPRLRGPGRTRTEDQAAPEDAGRSKDLRDRQGGPKDPSTFKGPPGSGQGQTARSRDRLGGQGQPAFKGPPSGGQGQSGGPPNKPVTQEQRPQRPPEQRPQRPPEQKPARQAAGGEAGRQAAGKEEEDEKKPPG